MSVKTIQTSDNGVAKAKTTSKATKPVKQTPAAKGVKKTIQTTPSQAQIVQQRPDKRVRLNALYQDHDQLQEALRDFDSIRTYGDIRITVYCGSTVHFQTSRHDTVQSGLKSLEQSIKQKLQQVQADLAGFEF